MRYELRKLHGGWCVWDREKKTPAVIDGMWATGLEVDEAEQLVSIMNLYDPDLPPTSNLGPGRSDTACEERDRSGLEGARSKNGIERDQGRGKIRR